MRRVQAVRLVVAVVAGLMVLAGLVALLLPLYGRPDDDGYVPACGSAVRPLLPPGPAVAPIYSEDCARQQDDRRQVAIPFVLTGVLVLGVTAIARPAPAEPSVGADVQAP